MSEKRKSSPEWVVAGGRSGELGHCTRCGVGLEINLPQPLLIITAAMDAFVKIHRSCPDASRTEPRPVHPDDWLFGRDTGISSKTIFSVITDRNVLGSWGADVPHDPGDFGRCYRLLKLFPSWMSELPRVSDKYPEWKPFVTNWEKLTAMYEAALLSNDGRPMHEFMRTL